MTCTVFKDEQDYAEEKSIIDTKTPMLIVVANKDNVVDNEKASQFYKKNRNEKNKYIEYEEADHTTITMDEQIGLDLAQKII